MSLEKMIQENTAAVQALTAALAAGGCAPQQPASAPKAATSKVAASAAAPKAAAPKAAGTTIDDARAATTNAIPTIGKQAVIDLLGEYSVAKVGDLGADQIEGYMADIQALLGAAV